MYYLSYICFICLKDTDKLQTVYLNSTEDAVKQMKYVLPEITLEPEIPVHICSMCHIKIHSFCTFKKQCLENYYRFTEKFRGLGNDRDQSFNTFPIETMYIKEENQIDNDLINEAPEELNSQINCVIKEDTNKDVLDETNSPGLNRSINEVSGMTDDIKSFECEEQHDQTNNFIEDNIYNIKFEDSEDPNLYQDLLSDIKNEINSEQDRNEIESVDLNNYNSERTVTNVSIASDLNQKINKESGIKEKIKSFECKICNKKFIQNCHKNLHMKTHAGIKDFQCSICEKKFLRNGDLKRHMKTHIGVKDFQCSFCEKKFIRNSDMKLHMKTHTGVKVFQCYICEKKFIRNSNMKLHMKTHTGVKDFQCSICDKKFIQNNSLKLHMKTHTGIKDFQCCICEKKFTLNSDMKLHMKIHSGIKNFQCSICEKKFIRNSNMKQHMKTHTGVKDFQCSICDKKFTLNYSLKLHMKAHIGVKDFQCSICEKKFTRNNDMKLHMKAHTGVKDFQCSVCEKKFILRSSLNRHLKLHNDIRDSECL